MVELSKIAAARLAQAPVAGPHPDAGLLTAFAERSLDGEEREGVLAHLATCSDCREVVALAAPESVAGLEVEASAPRKRWLTMPVMQWGAVTAAVVVVAIVVVMQSPRMQPAPAVRNEKNLTASAGKTAPAPAQPPAVAAADKASEAEGARATGSTAVRADEVKKYADARTNPARLDELAKQNKDEPAKQKKEDAGGTLANAWSRAGTRPSPAPVVNARAAEGGIAGHAAGGAGAAQSNIAVAQAERNEASGEKDAKLERRSTEQVAAAKPAAPTTASDSADAYAAAKSAPEPAPARRKSATGALSGTTYGPGYVAAAPQPTQTPQTMAPMESMERQRAQVKSADLRWTVTSDGRVQRSLDAGRNWINVAVATDKAVKFRALVTDGDEVWVGGTRGALYYSPDNGGTWRPKPIDRITGDIVRLNVNGKVLIISTSSGQTLEVSHEVFGDVPAKPPANR